MKHSMKRSEHNVKYFKKFNFEVGDVSQRCLNMLHNNEFLIAQK